MAASLSADKTPAADLAIRGVLFTNHVHFDARLGGTQPAPGGSSSVRVMSSHQLQVVWDLPNNQIILDIAADGSSCSSNFNRRLKPGRTDYSMFDGVRMYTCSKWELLSSTCEAR